MKTFREFVSGSSLTEAFKKGDSVTIKNAKSYDAMMKDTVQGTVIGTMDSKVMVKVGSGQLNVDPKDLMLTEAGVNEAFREYIVENSKKLYFVGKTLWLAYDEGSGYTTQVLHDTSYLTNKPSDKNYNAIVDMIKNSISSLKTKENSNYYFLEVPFYTDNTELDVWGGLRKPKQMIYMTLNKTGTLVLTIFKSKSEANAWFKS